MTICKDANDWNLLNEQVLLLSKKHGQLKQAITKMVQVVMGFLDDAPSTEVKLSSIETLRTVTEGKVRYSFGKATGGLLIIARFSSRSNGRGSLVYCLTSRKHKGT